MFANIILFIPYFIYYKLAYFVFVVEVLRYFTISNPKKGTCIIVSALKILGQGFSEIQSPRI